MSWDFVKLSDCCISISDGDHQPPPKADEGIPFVTISDITSYNQFNFENVMYVPDEYYESLDEKRKARMGDVLYSVVGSYGIPILIKEPQKFVFQRHIAILRPNTNVDSRYLYYAMKNPTFYAHADSVAIGAAQKTISLSALKDLKIPLPPLPIQRHIADILSAYDDLIENNQRQIKLLEEAAMRLYREWFVFMRFPGHESVRIVDGVPEGWEKIRTSSVMKFNYGKGLLEANRSGDGYPVFGSSGIVGYHDTPLVNENCIVVGRKGNVGSVYLSLMPSYPIDTVFYIIPKINIYYCYFELKSRTFVNNDSAVPGLNRENVEDMPMLLPSDKILEGFHNLIDPYIQRMSYLEQQNVLLQKARDALLPRLMNGGEGLKLEGGAV